MEGNPKQPQQPQQPRLFLTTEEIINGTLQYLSSRPYAEVVHLIDALRASKPFTPTPPDLEDAKTPGLEVKGEEEETVEKVEE